MHELKSVRKYIKTSNFSLKMFVSQFVTNFPLTIITIQKT